MGSYKEQVKKKILELEQRIAKDETEKLQLEIELNKLKLTEFEEEMRESNEQQLLKGQCPLTWCCKKTPPALDNSILP